MLGMDALIARIAPCHHIGIGKDGAIGLSTGQGSAEFFNVESVNSYVGKIAQILPGFNAVENLEDQYAKQCVFGSVSVQILIDDILNQILAHAVASAIDVGEFILAQDRVVGKRAAVLAPPPEDVHPLLNEVEVVFQNVVVGDDVGLLFSLHRYSFQAG